MHRILVYGTDWCEDTVETLETLAEWEIPHDYINIEEDPAAAQWVRDQNGGEVKTPTVDVAGRILSVPTTEELEDALRVRGYGV